METVTKPAIAFAPHFEKCVQGEADNVVRAQLLANAGNIAAHVVNYDNHASNKTLYQLLPLPGLPGYVDNLKALYPNAMRSKGAVARDIYLTLRHAAKICPYCSTLPVKTLDHFLPQKRFPELAITPYNLVPCCSDCNRTKWTYYATAANRQLIHPYYDDIDDTVWLGASVVYVEGSPTVSFHTVAIDNDPILTDRIAFQFDKLELATMYGIYGSALASKLVRRLQRLLNTGSPDDVREYLLEEWDDKFLNNPNSWETVTYRALADSPEYCAGQFGV